MSTTLKKNANGYNYKYTDIAEIHGWLEEQGNSYYQYIERIDGDDYIMTVPIISGEEKSPRRGCKVITSPFSNKTNPAQEQGSGITYARRYSLLMAFGLATVDDDAESLTRTEIPVEMQKINPTKVRSLMSKCNEDKVDILVVLKKCNVKEVTDLTEKQFAWVCHNWTKEFVNGDKGKD